MSSGPVVPSRRFSICERSPRISCITPSSHTHGIESFSLIAPPSFASKTAKVSSLSLIFFLRNFFMPLESRPSTSAVADCSASAVSTNLLKAFKETILPAFSGSANCSWRSSASFSFSGFLTRKRACPAGVSKRTSIYSAALSGRVPLYEYRLRPRWAS